MFDAALVLSAAPVVCATRKPLKRGHNENPTLCIRTRPHRRRTGYILGPLLLSVLLVHWMPLGKREFEIASSHTNDL